MALYLITSCCITGILLIFYLSIKKVNGLDERKEIIRYKMAEDSEKEYKEYIRNMN